MIGRRLFSVIQVTCGPDAAFSGNLCTATETSIGRSLGNGQTNRTASVTAGPLKQLACSVMAGVCHRALLSSSEPDMVTGSELKLRKN